MTVGSFFINGPSPRESIYCMLKWHIAVLGMVFGFLATYLGQARHLLVVGTGYSAKMLCSGVFLSNRSVDSFEKYEFSGLAASVFRTHVDYERASVTAYPLFGLTLSKLLNLPISTASLISPTLGCARRDPPNLGATNAWKIARESSLDPAPAEIQKLFDEELFDFEFSPTSMDTNQTRGVVVMHQGRVIAERYQTLLGVSSTVPQLGWSMTKSLHALVIGAAIQRGLLTMETPVQLRDLPEDHRLALGALTFGDLLHMSDILGLDEDYALHKGVVHMLFGAPDAGRFAARQRERTPPPSPTPASRFAWYYSSGVSNLLAKEFRSIFASDEAYWSFPREALFEPLGSSFVLETDPSGTFVASSFAYGSARDWAVLGQLVLQEGRWKGQQLVDRAFALSLHTPFPASGGHYSGQFWLNPARVDVREYNVLALDHRNKMEKSWMTAALPADALLMSGFEGQYVVVVPSRELVVVRLGFVKDTLRWDERAFFGKVQQSR